MSHCLQKKISIIITLVHSILFLKLMITQANKCVKPHLYIFFWTHFLMSSPFVLYFLKSSTCHAINKFIKYRNNMSHTYKLYESHIQVVWVTHTSCMSLTYNKTATININNKHFIINIFVLSFYFFHYLIIEFHK